MSNGLSKLKAILQPEEIARDHFQGVGSSNDGAEATYGGHFLGQATASALLTVDNDKHVHSLHAYFIRGGEPGKQIDYFVDRVRDGRSFCTRRVSAKQNDKVLFELMGSFCKLETGATIDAAPPPDFDELPAPETIQPYREMLLAQEPLLLPEDWVTRDVGIDIRVVNAPWSPNGPGVTQSIRSWFRSETHLDEDPHLHSAALAYQTDESLADILLIPFGKTWCSEGTFCVSLDHALWFHEPADLNNWHFIDQQVVVAKNGRGVGNGYVWSQDGRLVASFTQEALIRL